jgi:hypothetical protein
MSLPNYFDSSENGAPVINNVAGSLVAALIAIGVTGFNVKSVTQIVVTGGVAVATCPAHGYSNVYGKLIRVAGAPVPALNGDFRPSNVLTNSFEYAAPGVADGTYVGTIEARRAPLGWEVAHINGDSTVAIFARSGTEATESLLRVVDTGAAPASATSARWFGVESATGVDAYTGQFPTNGQLANGHYVWKGSNSATAKRWFVVGDGPFFYLLVASASSPLATVDLAYFGDFVSHKSIDTFGCMAGGNTADASSRHSLSQDAINTGPLNYGRVLARVSALTGGAVRFNTIFLQWSSTLGVNGPSYPSPVNDSFQFLRPVFITEENSAFVHPVRGEMPGMAYPLCVNVAPTGALVTPATGDGRTYLFARTGNSEGSAIHIMIDLTGPWR